MKVILEIILLSAQISYTARKYAIQNKFSWRSVEERIYNSRAHPIDLFYNWAAASAAAVGSVGWLACSLFLLLCRSLARSLRCSTAKLTCHKNWNCYQLVRAFDVEDYCIKLGWCNGKCILHICPPCYFSSSRLPRPLHQAATYYMTALRAALPDRPNSRSLPPPRSHYVSCGLKSTKCCQALHLSFRILQYIIVKGLIDSVHWIEQPNAASTVFGHKNYAKVRLSHFSHFALHCTARRVQPEL